MANLSAIKLPNGTTYNLKDSVSGYTTNTGTITKVQTTAGAHTTINVSSGAASFNVPTKTSHLTNDSGFITSYVNTATAADNILDGSNSGTEITYAPYTSRQTGLSFYTGTTAPNGTTRLNLNGYLYATKLYSNGSEVLTSYTETDPTVPSWAKASSKPTYTANEVGALSSSTTYVSTITTSAGTHSTISSKSGSVSFKIPTKTSHLTNDSGFITSDSDEKVKSTTVTAASTMYLVGSSSNSTTTGGVNKHASGILYVTADNVTGGHTELRLGNTTVTTTAGGKEGQIRFYGTTATNYVTLKGGAPSSNRTVTLPDKTGTIALTSDIPTVPDVSGKIDTAGSGLSKSGTTLNHASTITAGTVGTSSATSGITLAVPYVTYNGTGHITASGTHTHTITSASSSAAGLMSSNDYTFLSSLNSAMSASTTILYLKTDSSTTDSSLLTAIDDLGWTSDVVS